MLNFAFPSDKLNVCARGPRRLFVKRGGRLAEEGIFSFFFCFFKLKLKLLLDIYYTLLIISVRFLYNRFFTVFFFFTFRKPVLEYHSVREDRLA